MLAILENACSGASTVWLPSYSTKEFNPRLLSLPGRMMLTVFFVGFFGIVLSWHSLTPSRYAPMLEKHNVLPSSRRKRQSSGQRDTHAFIVIINSSSTSFL